MNVRQRFWNLFRYTRGARRLARPSGSRCRLGIESLESRQLLAVTWSSTIANQTVLAGAPLNVALNGSDSLSNAITYSVSVTNSSLTNAQGAAVPLGYTVEGQSGSGSSAAPTTNPSLSITVSDPADSISGTMVFQLFQNLVPNAVNQITNLVNGTSSNGVDFYNGLDFWRVLNGFVIQGGDPNGNGTGGPGYQWDDEYNSNLQFTGTGVLAMANSGPDTNGSQFFITDGAQRELDFRYTIFGFMTEGADILQEIENVPVHTQPSFDEVSAPDNPVTMTSVTTFTDPQNGVLQLSAPNGTTGTATVTVTAVDSVTGDSTSQTFQVTVGADTTVDPPFLNRPTAGIPPIQTTVNTPVSFTIPGLDVNGNAINYTATVSSAESSDLTVSVNPTTGEGTLTPINGASGVFSIEEGVSAPNPSSSDPNAFDYQQVPVYVAPGAPSGIQLLSGSNNLTDLNNSAGKPLYFQVNGVVAGATVQLSVDGTVIPTTVEAQSGTAVLLATTLRSTPLAPNSTTLADGSHSVTATQILQETNVAVGNESYSPTLTSAASSPLTITIDTVPPVFTFTANTTAMVGVPYTCQVTTSADSAGAVTYGLTQAPTGMAINAATGLITWTPTVTQVPSAQVIVVATDPAGNTAQRQFTVSVALPLTAGMLVPPGTSTVSAFVSSRLSSPQDLVFDAAGNLYISNFDNTTLTKVTPAGAVSALVSRGLEIPTGLAFDTAGNLYVTNLYNSTITKVTPAGAVSTFVSSGLDNPSGLAFDKAGNLYVTNWGNNTISKVTRSGVVSTFVSSGLDGPWGLAFDSAGNLYVANLGNSTLSKVTPAGAVSTFVSSGLASPDGLAFDAVGNLVVANRGNSTLSKVTPAGAVSTFVSSGLAAPEGLAFDAAGNLYVANGSNNTISRITPSTVIAGQAFSGTVFHFTDADPAATASDYTALITLGDGNSVTVDSSGVVGSPPAGAGGRIVADAAGGFDVQLSYTYTGALRNQTFSVQVIAVDGASTGANTQITVLPQDYLAPSQVVFATQPGNTAASVGITPALRVAVENAENNVVSSDDSTVTLTLSNGTFANGSNTATAVASDGVATFSNLRIDKTGTYALQATSENLTQAISSSFTITPGVASKLVFLQQPTKASAGASISPAVTVEVEDAYGNVLTADNTDKVTVAIASSKPSGGKLLGASSSYTKVQVSGGVATLNSLSIGKVGTYTLRAAATSGKLTKAMSAAFSVTPAAADKLVFLQQPTKASAGAPISPAVTVEVEDAYGNVLTNDNSDLVAIAIRANRAGGTLNGTATATAVAGVARFSNLSINDAGTGYTLQATSGSLASATSAAFNITAVKAVFAAATSGDFSPDLDKADSDGLLPPPIKSNTAGAIHRRKVDYLMASWPAS